MLLNFNAAFLLVIYIMVIKIDSELMFYISLTDWPKNHNFQFFKLEIENIFLIDWFGGPKPLTVEQYLHPKM